MRGTAALDLVLVVVVYVALTMGPATGLLAGAVAGLVQDALSSGIIGIGGLAKTVVGFLIGLVGTQFIVAAAAALRGVLRRHGAACGDLHGPLRAARLAAFRRPYGGVLSQGAANALVGVVGSS